MLTPIANAPRDYAWGSMTLIAALQNRAPSGTPEAEVWFGDHPGSPATVPDGRTLDEWRAEVAGESAPRLPYLLKLLAAASPLSIQAHPSKEQAEVGFAREEAAGVARDADDRIYRDANHKPELIVAISDTFTALAGLRPLAGTRRILAALGDAGAPIAARLDAPDAEAALRDTIGWLLSGSAQPEVDAVIAALHAAGPDAADAEVGRDLATLAAVAERCPGDAGVAVALLMNVVELQRGEGVFVPAGVLHAYLAGLGVEIMASSDNVLRGGLTPKHIAVDELTAILDARPAAPALVQPAPVAEGLWVYPTPVDDFALRVARVGAEPVSVEVDGPAIVLATAGEVRVSGGSTAAGIVLTPGRAAFATADERMLIVQGRGEAFIAQPALGAL
ncbi:mannose-6-phosphate isomerase, class I [Microbacterium terricola]|uniref:mannose-6-phosphate isomerase n=1 Tax=Microbacterium terricola TaxID=344163 RepID=A0ABM8DWL2_9MICO|nr:mannose-6-phosphate isomerase, class I [Microbacterium terricola]UYK39227.1 mannose-6-phosphate isomerase, class I [Microbacterium terricola]BDV30053.1 mannose-6-phosphate isomerase, class I [Microbacterium terricola]